MKNDNCCATTRCSIYVIGVLGSLLVIAIMVGVMHRYAPTAPLTAVRVAERVKNLKDVRDASAPVLVTYDWQDKTKDIVRVPISRAKDLVLQEWQNPAAARSNLMARATKAFAVAPPPPNPYE
jgi:hypothetical protein